MKIAFLYHPNNHFLKPDHSDPNFYRFFMVNLKDHPGIEVTYGRAKVFNCHKLQAFDVLLLYVPIKGKFIPSLMNLNTFKGKIVAMSGDCHNANRYKAYSEKLGIKNFFFTNTEEYFNKHVPPAPPARPSSNYNYKQIIVGIDTDIYKAAFLPWEDRIADKILNTGLVHNPHFYGLRTVCNMNPHVEYKEKKDVTVGNQFPKLLSRYRASIAACSECFTLRFLESPAAGCLTFMEDDGKNGLETLGFTDGIDAVFITKENYKEKINEYINSVNDPKWKEIADKGRIRALSFTGSAGINNLIEWIKTL